MASERQGGAVTFLGEEVSQQTADLRQLMLEHLGVYGVGETPEGALMIVDAALPEDLRKVLVGGFPNLKINLLEVEAPTEPYVHQHF